MADSQNAWAAIAARSRRGVVGTRGEQLPSVAARGVIGSVPGLVDAPATHAPAPVDSDRGPAAGSESSAGVGLNVVADSPEGGPEALGATTSASPAPAADVGQEEAAELLPASFRANPLAALASRKDREPDRVERSYAEPASPFASLASESQRIAPIRDIQAVKVVNHLVCGISLGPGSSAPKAAKAKALKDQILHVDAGARKLVEALGLEPERADWMHAQCSEALASTVAQHQLAKPGRTGQDIAEFIEQASEVAADALSRSNQDLADVVGSWIHGRYRPATGDDPAAAEDRLTVSLAGAMGDLLDKVLSPCLSLAGKPFTYAMEPSRVVELLGAQVLGVASKASIEISSIDMRVSHLQGSMRRVAALIGHEYVHMTLGILKWVQSDNASAEKMEERVRSAAEWLASTGVNEMVEKAKSSFLMVERIAPALLEQAREEGALPAAVSRAAPQRGG